MNLTLTRQAIADAVNTVAGLNVQARPMRMPKLNDGWVVISRIEPATFGTCNAVFTAVVVLGADPDLAEQRLEEIGVQVVDAVTKGLSTADVELNPEALIVGNANTPLYCAAVSMTVEVD